ncbi:hypothetical protein CB1_002312003 [Camelus ferus]|nr:hypothetical protein CB1_002312003 [Camelus ferus]
MLALKLLGLLEASRCESMILVCQKRGDEDSQEGKEEEEIGTKPSVIESALCPGRGEAEVFSDLSPAQDSHMNVDLPPVSEQIMQTLSELAKSFQDMADRCLLVLHLEVRVHCFHYLIPLAKEGNYAIVANVESMDYDPLVVKLNKDISAIEEAMSASLQQHKFQYIFEGLGHLISCILINGAQYFRRISESGIKKMCRNIFVLQQNLTNITMSREADLDFARLVSDKDKEMKAKVREMLELLSLSSGCSSGVCGSCQPVLTVATVITISYKLLPLRLLLMGLIGTSLCHIKVQKLFTNPRLRAI